VVVRPGTSGFSAGSLIALLAAVLSAVVAIQIKQLSRIDAADTIVFHTYLFWVPMSLVPALFVWRWPTPDVWPLLFGTGVFGTIAQLLWTRALRLGDVSALQPISFMQLPMVAVAGWFLFGETIDRWTVTGAAIIFAANAYIAFRETQLSRQRATTAPVEAAKPGE
jgi:drug/metabolite transporter (DMT)-like permease